MKKIISLNEKKKKLVIYTALFGDYDKLLEPKGEYFDCDFVCFTDQSSLRSNIWDIRIVNKTEKNNTLENRKYKFLPHKFFSEYKYSIYIDSNILIRKDPVALCEYYLSESIIALPQHFLRKCIFTEAEECYNLGKISRIEYENFRTKLNISGFPHDYGLGENNILIRKFGDSKLDMIMEKWWDLFKKGPQRDQLSLMYLLWKNNIPYTLMKENSRNANDYFSYSLHISYEKLPMWKRTLLLCSATRQKNFVNRLIGFILDKIFKNRV